MNFGHYANGRQRRKSVDGQQPERHGHYLNEYRRKRKEWSSDRNILMEVKQAIEAATADGRRTPSTVKWIEGHGDLNNLLGNLWMDLRSQERAGVETATSTK
jgi:hypothetical protein